MPMVDAWQLVVFWALFVMMGFSAVRVVTSSNVVHAALYLVVTLLGAAALFVLLLAEFVAWVQVLVYVGAIIVLMLFGLMLTRAPIGKGKFHNDQRLVAALTAGALFAVTTWIIVDAFDGQKIALSGASGTRAQTIGEVIFSSFVWPFELVSILLLAALIGAVVIARRD